MSDGKCSECGGQLRTANLDAIRCDDCGLLHMLVETQPYAHRNGSTEPPTQPGWYWIQWPDNSVMDDGDGIATMCFVGYKITEGGNIEYFIVSAGTSETIKTGEINVRWWGPLQPPWEPQQ